MDESFLTKIENRLGMPAMCSLAWSKQNHEIPWSSSKKSKSFQKRWKPCHLGWNHGNMRFQHLPFGEPLNLSSSAVLPRFWCLARWASSERFLSKFRWRPWGRLRGKRGSGNSFHGRKMERKMGKGLLLGNNCIDSRCFVASTIMPLPSCHNHSPHFQSPISLSSPRNPCSSTVAKCLDMKQLQAP